MQNVFFSPDYEHVASYWRPQSKLLKSLNVGLKVVMLTGGSKEIAFRVASKLGVGESYPEVLPEGRGANDRET